MTSLLGVVQVQQRPFLTDESRARTGRGPTYPAHSPRSQQNRRTARSLADPSGLQTLDQFCLIDSTAAIRRQVFILPVQPSVTRWEV